MIPVLYTYIGFQYLITEEDGRQIATPIHGSHRAANRHRGAALQAYLSGEPSEIATDQPDEVAIHDHDERDF